MGTLTSHAWTKEFLSFTLDSDATLRRQIKEDSGLIDALELRNLTPDEGHHFAMSMVVTKRLNESNTPQNTEYSTSSKLALVRRPIAAMETLGPSVCS